MSPIGDIPKPTHEAQVRPLIGLEPEKACAAWKKAVQQAGNELVTGKMVKAAVAELCGEVSGKKPRKMQKPKPEMDKNTMDDLLHLLKEAETSVRAGASNSTVLRLLRGIRQCVLERQG